MVESDEKSKDFPTNVIERIVEHFMDQIEGRKEPEKKEEPKKEETPEFRCPECNGKVPLLVKHCPHCGVELEWEE